MPAGVLNERIGLIATVANPILQKHGSSGLAAKTVCSHRRATLFGLFR